MSLCLTNKHLGCFYTSATMINCFIFQLECHDDGRLEKDMWHSMTPSNLWRSPGSWSGSKSSHVHITNRLLDHTRVQNVTAPTPHGQSDSHVNYLCQFWKESTWLVAGKSCISGTHATEKKSSFNSFSRCHQFGTKVKVLMTAIFKSKENIMSCLLIKMQLHFQSEPNSEN